MDITTTPAWSALQSLARPAHLRTLFAEDPQRSLRYRLQAGDLRIDYSKHLIDDEVVAALLAVVSRPVSQARRDAMFAGEAINITERSSRAAHRLARAASVRW